MLVIVMISMGRRCVKVKDEKSKSISKHNEVECLSYRWLKCKGEKRIANEKRRQFYKSDGGIAMKAKYSFMYLFCCRYQEMDVTMK